METQLRDRQTGVEQGLLECRDVGVVDELVVDGRHRVLPQLRLGDPWAEVAGDRTHVAVQQLVPGLGEGEPELVVVLVEAARDLLVGRVLAQREIGRQHRGPVLPARVEGVGVGLLGVLGDPLVSARGTLGELPLVTEQVVEEPAAPPGRRRRPGDLEAAGDGVGTLAGAVGAVPAEALALDRRGLGLGADVVARPAPWVFPKEWPPAIRATVSSSFIAIRRNVSRMSRAAATGSGWPLGPSGFT